MSLVLEKPREAEILATHVSKDRLFFCRTDHKRIWFGTQLVGKPDTLQTMFPEHVRDFDLYNIWRKPQGVYEYGPYRYTILQAQDKCRWYAVSAPGRGYDYVTAMREDVLMKLLFFANSTATLGV